jgi:hypothetical protein
MKDKEEPVSINDNNSFSAKCAFILQNKFEFLKKNGKNKLKLF